MSVDFSKKSIVFITGASRGIGRGIAVEISKLLHPDSVLVLIATSLKSLEETKSLITTSRQLQVITYPLDLSSAAVRLYEDLFDEVDKQTQGVVWEYSVMFHNAATSGTLGNAADLNGADEWKRYYELNVVSCFLLNNVFVSKYRKSSKRSVIVNVTSAAGSVPFPNMAMYASAKAARNMFFKILALEEPDLLVLSYSPGAVATDMLKTTIAIMPDEQSRRRLSELKHLSPEETSLELLDVLQKSEFKSGDIVDYYKRKF